MQLSSNAGVPVHTKNDFRADINGLRAWAVLAVVLFHFDIPGFNGGYVGVDVFFVISGFLMTKIICSSLEAGRFGLTRFYLARAQRILPALVFLCVVLLAMGWLILLPIEYSLLSDHVIASLLFFSNVQFWRENGYFDAASHEKWLLHTWSLSVEWQFYFALPLILIGVWRIFPKRSAIVTLFLLGAGASLALSVTLAYLKPVAAFYLLPTRGWELLLGGFAFLLHERWPASNRSRLGLELTGFAAIIFSIVSFNPQTIWPGLLALLPVLGTGLVIGARRQTSLLTSSQALQWVGTRSYSIYLWHWPVYVLLNYWELFDQPLFIALGICASLSLGHLSYHLIENPSRIRLQKLNLFPAVAAISISAITVTGLSFLIRANEGVPLRLPPAVRLAASEVANRNPRGNECEVGPARSVPQCTYGGPFLGAIVIGDSHAASIVRSVEESLPDKSKHVLDWTMSGCPTIAGVKLLPESPTSAKCGEFINWAIKESAKLPRDAPLLIANRSSVYAFGQHNLTTGNGDPIPMIYFGNPASTATQRFLHEYRENLVSTACKFATTRQVFLLRPIPEMHEHVPRSAARSIMRGEQAPDVSISLREYQERHRFIWAAQDAARTRCGVTILDPLPYMCDSERCFGLKSGRPLYFDDDHLSQYGALQLSPLWRVMFQGAVASTY